MGIKMKSGMGFDDVDRKFRTLAKIAPKQIRIAFREGVAEIFADTQVKVPKETNRLARTGKVVGNVVNGYHVSYSIWYGEPGEGPGIVDYAAAVHEILKAKHAPGTGPKFVELPLVQSGPMLKRKVKNAIEDAVKEAFHR